MITSLEVAPDTDLGYKIMRKLLKVMVCAFLVSFIVALQSCDNFSRNAKKAWDSGLAENISHRGTFKGYAAVYTIDWIEGSRTRSSDTYRVYLKDNGEYVIDYEDETYILKKVDEPMGENPYSLKWKIDYNHYVEDVPNSY